MARYLTKQILSAEITLFCITAILFLLLSLVRGGPLDVLRASGADLSPAELETLRRTLGLDKPVWVRYALWLRDVAGGDLGTSFRYSAPVSSIIRQRLGPSLLLSLTGLALALILALPIGVMAAYHPGSWWDRVSSFFALVGSSVPRFIVCIAGIYFLSYRLRLFPAMGMHAAGTTSLADLLHHLTLPALIIAFGTMGYFIKQTRSACLEVFQEDYMKTARAKGLSEWEVVVKHGLRTALAPILTQAALELPTIVGGSTLTEKIFAWPGIGSLMIEAISNRDQPLIMGVALLIAVTVLSCNILLNVAYGLLDPRVTYQ